MEDKIRKNIARQGRTVVEKTHFQIYFNMVGFVSQMPIQTNDRFSSGVFQRGSLEQ
jgi:negative regulator of sigma E activity